MEHHYGSPAQPSSMMSSIFGGHVPGIPPASVFGPGTSFGNPNSLMQGPGSMINSPSVHAPSSIIGRSIDPHTNGPGNTR